MYNTTYSAPKVPGKDDITGEPLSKRPDDTPVRRVSSTSSRGRANRQETFTKRLKSYYQSTAPLLEYFSSEYPDALYSLSGSTSDEVLIAAGLIPRPHLPPNEPVPDNLSAVDQLWPQLVQLVEPFGLKKRAGKLRDADVSNVRDKADDLADPAEKEKEAVKQ